ncbi:MAG: porin family protein [Alphaproteobacteria bacterium]|nr:porin family protein [Alphaproteobacteria bacterium]
MKRITGLLALGAVLAAPSMALAEPQSGFYVAPRLIYGSTHMRDVGMPYYDSTGVLLDVIAIGNKRDNTFGGSIAVGYDLSKMNAPVRAELEYAVFTEAKAEIVATDTIRQSNRIQTLFMNAYYDIDTGTKFTPYVGAGIGMGFVRAKGLYEWMSSHPTSSKTKTNFAWNLGLGMGYKIADNLALDIGYRFVDLGKAKSGLGDFGGGASHNTETNRIYQHQFMVGTRVKF